MIEIRDYRKLYKNGKLVYEFTEMEMDVHYMHGLDLIDMCYTKLCSIFYTDELASLRFMLANNLQFDRNFFVTVWTNFWKKRGVKS